MSRERLLTNRKPVLYHSPGLVHTMNVCIRHIYFLRFQPIFLCSYFFGRHLAQPSDRHYTAIFLALCNGQAIIGWSAGHLAWTEAANQRATEREPSCMLVRSQASLYQLPPSTLISRLAGVLMNEIYASSLQSAACLGSPPRARLDWKGQGTIPRPPCWLFTITLSLLRPVFFADVLPSLTEWGLWFSPAVPYQATKL